MVVTVTVVIEILNANGKFCIARCGNCPLCCEIMSIDAPLRILFLPCKDKLMTLLYLIRVQRGGEVWKKMLAFIILSCILCVLLSRWYTIFTILLFCWIIITTIIVIS